MDQTLDFRKCLSLNRLTIPITDLLLTKLQIVRIINIDIKDIIAILGDHNLGTTDEREIIKIVYISDLCKENWVLYHSILTNIIKIIEFLKEGKIESIDRVLFKEKLSIIGKSMIKQKKSLRWKLRNKLGT